MTVYRKCTLRQLPGVIKRNMNSLQARVETAMRRTANSAQKRIAEAAPKAFGELENSVHLVGRMTDDPNEVAAVSVDAPHAYAVEVGSPPHTPDFERLLAWVKLRGMQALKGSRYLKSRGVGPTTFDQATRVGRELRRYRKRATKAVGGSGGFYNGIDEPEIITRRIMKAIEERGTRPRFFVRDSLPAIEQELQQRVGDAVNADVERTTNLDRSIGKSVRVE